MLARLMLLVMMGAGMGWAQLPTRQTTVNVTSAGSVKVVSTLSKGSLPAMQHTFTVRQKIVRPDGSVWSDVTQVRGSDATSSISTYVTSSGLNGRYNVYVMYKVFCPIGRFSSIVNTFAFFDAGTTVMKYMLDGGTCKKDVMGRPYGDYTTSCAGFGQCPSQSQLKEEFFPFATDCPSVVWAARYWWIVAGYKFCFPSIRITGQGLTRCVEF